MFYINLFTESKDREIFMDTAVPICTDKTLTLIELRAVGIFMRKSSTNVEWSMMALEAQNPSIGNNGNKDTQTLYVKSKSFRIFSESYMKRSMTA